MIIANNLFISKFFPSFFEYMESSLTILYSNLMSSIKIQRSSINSSFTFKSKFLHIPLSFSPEFEKFITGIIGIIKSKNFVLSLSRNISSFIA